VAEEEKTTKSEMKRPSCQFDTIDSFPLKEIPEI
jgi:hypothetical protein